MRLITMEMSNAVHSRRKYKKSNTEAIINNNSNASVYLFENKIIKQIEWFKASLLVIRKMELPIMK